MIKCLKEENNGTCSFIYQGYNVQSTNISLNEIPLFLTDFSIFLNSEKIKEIYGFLYDITICTITVNDNNTCDISFICRVSK